jgi:hypothetical protein
MTEQIAIGACALMVSLAGLTAVARVWPATVRGRHRAPLLRPVEALVQVTVRCRAEGRDTVHARTRVTGELICRSCGHFNTTPGGFQ